MNRHLAEATGRDTNARVSPGHSDGMLHDESGSVWLENMGRRLATQWDELVFASCACWLSLTISIRCLSVKPSSIVVLHGAAFYVEHKSVL